MAKHRREDRRRHMVIWSRIYGRFVRKTSIVGLPLLYQPIDWA